MTAELRVKAAVTADGKQASAELQQVAGRVAETKQALVEAQAATKAGAAALKELRKDTSAAASAIEAARDALIQQRAAEVLAAASHNEAAAAARRLATASDTQASAAKAAAAANDNLAKANGAARAASANLGQQIGDIAQGLSAGINPAQIFAQQAGQVAFALNGMGGSAGKVGAFLNGPWGIAVTAGAVVLAPLVASLFESSAASEAAAAAMKANKEAADELAAAQRALDEATGKTRRTLEENAAAVLDSARSSLADVAAKRQQIDAALQLAIAERRVQLIRSQAPGQRGEVASLGLPVQDNIIAGLEQQRKDNDFAAAGARLAVERAQRQVDLAGAIESVRLKTDAAAKADKDYSEGMKALNGLVLTRAEYEQRVEQLTARRDAAVKAARDGDRRAASAAREHTRELREQEKALATLAAAPGRITSQLTAVSNRTSIADILKDVPAIGSPGADPFARQAGDPLAASIDRIEARPTRCRTC